MSGVVDRGAFKTLDKFDNIATPYALAWKNNFLNCIKGLQNMPNIARKEARNV